MPVSLGELMYLFFVLVYLVAFSLVLFSFLQYRLMLQSLNQARSRNLHEPYVLVYFCFTLGLISASLSSESSESCLEVFDVDFWTILFFFDFVVFRIRNFIV